MYFSRSAVAAHLAQRTGSLENASSIDAHTLKKLAAAIASGVLVLFLAASFVSVLI